MAFWRLGKLPATELEDLLEEVEDYFEGPYQGIRKGYVVGLLNGKDDMMEVPDLSKNAITWVVFNDTIIFGMIYWNDVLLQVKHFMEENPTVNPTKVCVKLNDSEE